MMQLTHVLFSNTYVAFNWVELINKIVQYIKTIIAQRIPSGSDTSNNGVVEEMSFL